MADEKPKIQISLEEQAEFAKWADAQKAQGLKTTIRAVKAAMKCGQIKAEAYLRQYHDDLTRAAVEITQVAEVPESVLNAISEFMNEQVKSLAMKVREQIKAAESRAEEMAEQIEIAESTAAEAQQKIAVAQEEATAFKAKSEALAAELERVQAQLEKVQNKAEEAVVRAAAAEARLEEVRRQLAEAQKG